MADWMGPAPTDTPEWAQIRADLRHRIAASAGEPAPGWTRPRREPVKVRRVNVIRLLVVLMALAVCYLATFDTYALGLAAWIGGLMVLAAASACYTVERWTP